MKHLEKKVLNHSHLYFVVVDSNGNIFGHYHPSSIHKADEDNLDSNIFMFTLKSNGIHAIEKYPNKGDESIGTYIFSGGYWECNGGNYDGYYNYSDIGETNSNYIYPEISNRCDKCNERTFTNGKMEDLGVYYATSRNIVIEMI